VLRQVDGEEVALQFARYHRRELFVGHVTHVADDAYFTQREYRQMHRVVDATVNDHQRGRAVEQTGYPVQRGSVIPHGISRIRTTRSSNGMPAAFALIASSGRGQHDYGEVFLRRKPLLLSVWIAAAQESRIRVLASRHPASSTAAAGEGGRDAHAKVSHPAGGDTVAGNRPVTA